MKIKRELAICASSNVMYKYYDIGKVRKRLLGAVYQPVRNGNWVVLDLNAENGDGLLGTAFPSHNDAESVLMQSMGVLQGV